MHNHIKLSGGIGFVLSLWQHGVVLHSSQTGRDDSDIDADSSPNLKARSSYTMFNAVSSWKVSAVLFRCEPSQCQRTQEKVKTSIKAL